MPGNLTEVGDGLGAAGVPGHASNGEAGVAIEDELAAGEMADKPGPQRHQLVLGKERHPCQFRPRSRPAGRVGMMSSQSSSVTSVPMTCVTVGGGLGSGARGAAATAGKSM